MAAAPQTSQEDEDEGVTMWDKYPPLYFPIYNSYQHVHVLHIADSPSPSGFLLVAGNLHDNGLQ